MKKIVLVFAFIGSMAHAFSSNEACFLPSVTNDEEVQEDPRSLRLGRASDQEIKSLPGLSKAQLIRAAFQNEKLQFNDRHVIRAIVALRDASEGEDVYLVHFSYRGKKFTYVQLYPGGNEGGVIFPFGSAEAVATVGDQDIDCIKPARRF